MFVWAFISRLSHPLTGNCPRSGQALQRAFEPSIKSRADITTFLIVLPPGYLTRMEHHREPIAARPQLSN